MIGSLALIVIFILSIGGLLVVGRGLWILIENEERRRHERTR